MPKVKDKSGFKVMVEHRLDEQLIKDLMSTAMESGIGYWAKFEGYTLASGVKRGDFKYQHEMPFTEGCILEFTIREGVDKDDGWYQLDRTAMEGGLQTMANKYPEHMKNLLNDSWDAETADVFVQCSLFGEIVYG